MASPPRGEQGIPVMPVPLPGPKFYIVGGESDRNTFPGTVPLTAHVVFPAPPLDLRSVDVKRRELAASGGYLGATEAIDQLIMSQPSSAMRDWSEVLVVATACSSV